MLAQRSIPACAGEPHWQGCSSRSAWVYPRVCGGTFRDWARQNSGLGLSPRVRGNPDVDRARAKAFGSIPACAGEPTTTTTAHQIAWVYPRVCGGTSLACTSWRPPLGLSPRVRGNQHPFRSIEKPVGSIPACAGEPNSLKLVRPAARVYPRVCGGTGSEESTRSALKGLSPRVRGNPVPAISGNRPPGSIPACAGEPYSPTPRES